MSNQLQEKPRTAVQGFTDFITGDEAGNYLTNVLGNRKEKFVTNIVSMVNGNEKLAVCTPMSLITAAIMATTLNLSLNQGFGYAYVIPYEKKENRNGQWVVAKTEAQFQIGYKGYIQLAMRTGEYHKINAVPIHSNQFVRWNEFTEDLLIEQVEGNGEIVGYAAYFRLTNGFEKTMYWSYEKMLKHADTYSQAFSAVSYKKLLNNEIQQNQMYKFSSFWYKNFDEMANKTMLKQLLSKFGILTEEIQTAIASDQAIITEDLKPNYIDNIITTEGLLGATESEIEAETIEDVPYPAFDENGELLR